VATTDGVSDHCLIAQSKIGVCCPSIRTSYAASGGIYGYRRVHLDLREMGESCGKHRVARIMKVNDIKAIHGYKVPRVIYGRPSIVTPNRLQREFAVEHPDRVWVTGISVPQQAA
jgi:putative transposase